jgi:hypothetical protein
VLTNEIDGRLSVSWSGMARAKLYANGVTGIPAERLALETKRYQLFLELCWTNEHVNTKEAIAEVERRLPFPPGLSTTH